MIYARISTPLGGAYVTLRDDALAGLYFDGARHAPAIASEWQRDDDHPVAQACAQQLAEYFAGTRRETISPG